jgi:hypothetical protein
MGRARQKKIPPEKMLGALAMRFRGTRDAAERAAVAGEYAAVVTRLIEGGKWKEMPSFEDMLPDEEMPRAFFDYWGIPCPHQQGGGRRPA